MTYKSADVQTSMVGVYNETTNNLTGYLNYRLVQYPMLQTDIYTRQAIVGVIALIGGFIGMMKNFSYFLLGSYQTFTLDKSMIKKTLSKRLSTKNDGLARDRAQSSWCNE